MNTAYDPESFYSVTSEYDSTFVLLILWPNSDFFEMTRNELFYSYFLLLRSPLLCLSFVSCHTGIFSYFPHSYSTAAFDTWRPNRHYSNILPLFRNHVTRNAVAMFPPPPNPVISIEHGVPRFPFVRCATHRGCRGEAWFWGCQNYPTCTAPTTTPPVPHNLKTLLLKQQTQAVNDRIPAKGCRHLLVKPWAHGTGKGNTCQLCGAIINDRGEITRTSKSVQRKLVNDEDKCHSSRTVEGRTELDLVQDEVDEAKRLLGVGQAIEEMAQIKKLLEANSEPAGQ